MQGCAAAWGIPLAGGSCSSGPHDYLLSWPSLGDRLAPAAAMQPGCERAFSLALLPVQARAVEQFCVDRWRRQGVQPPPHPLVPDPATLSGFLRHPDEW